MQTFEELLDTSVAAVKAQLGQVLIGAADDIDRSIRHCMDRALRATAIGRMDVVQRNISLLPVIGERNRIRASGSGWTVARAALGAAVSLVSGFATKGLVDLAALVRAAVPAPDADPTDGD
jgi:hypothetical protein